MTKKRVHLTFPENLVQEPIIYRLATDFDIVTNIRRANVEETIGWVILELDGEDDALARGLDYLTGLGVTVSTIAGDILEG
jgi:ABC-type methionine transport system ATPase subunit